MGDFITLQTLNGIGSIRLVRYQSTRAGSEDTHEFPFSADGILDEKVFVKEYTAQSDDAVFQICIQSQ